MLRDPQSLLFRSEGPQSIIEAVQEGRLPESTMQILSGLHMLNVYPEFIHKNCPSTVQITEVIRNAMYTILGRSSMKIYARVGVGMNSRILLNTTFRICKDRCRSDSLFHPTCGSNKSLFSLSFDTFQVSFC